MGVTVTKFLTVLLVALSILFSVSAATLKVDQASGSDISTCQTIPCLTISYALNQSSNGDTINISAGTYNETLEINKEITLNGINAIIQPLEGGSYGMLLNTSNITLNNLILDFNGPNDNQSSPDVGIDLGTTNTPQLTNILINASTIYPPLKGAGISSRDTEGIETIITNNNFLSQDSGSVGILIDRVATAHIENNVFLGNTTGISVMTGNVTINANSFSGNDTNTTGIRLDVFEVQEYNNITISNNILDNLTQGIVLGGDNAQNIPVSANITKNNITNNTYGIWVKYNTTLNISQNIILDNEYGIVNNLSSDEVKAEVNYWGKVLGPNGTDTVGTVDTDPWAYNLSFNIDDSDPITYIISPNASDYFLGNFFVEITDEDNGSQLTLCEYQVKENGTITLNWTERTCNQGVTVNATDFCTIEGDDICRVLAKATDLVGHTSFTKNRNFGIDRTAPNTTTDAPSGWQSSNYNVTLTATDNLSGVNYTTYVLNSNDPVNGTKVLINETGNHTITFFSRDIARNVETTMNVTAALDLTDPVAVIQIESSPYSEGSSIKLNASASSDNVQVSSYFWDFGDGTNDTSVNTSKTYAANGSYIITLTVTDHVGLTNSTTLNITVDDTAPISNFTASNYTPRENNNNNVFDTVTFTSTATAAVDSIVNYTWDFGDNTNSTDQNPTKNFDLNGTFTVTLTVKDNDGSENAFQDNITVQFVDDDPEFVGQIGTINLSEDQSTVYDLTNSSNPGYFIDEEGSMYFQVLGSSDNVTIVNNSNLITITPDANFFGNSSDFNIFARDPAHTTPVVSDSFKVVVASVNDAPNLTLTDITIDENSAALIINLSNNVTDIEGDSITFNASETNSSQVTCTISSENLSITSVGEWFGTTSCNITANDGQNNSNVETIQITVNNVNDAPTISSNATTQATEDIPYSYQVTASDPDNLIQAGIDTITFSLTESPSGMAINPTSGMIGWNPTNDQVGDNNVTVMAADGNGGNDTQSFTIAVNNSNDAPTSPSLSSPSNNSQIILENTTLSWSASSDDDNDSITYYVFASTNISSLDLVQTTSSTQIVLSNLTDNSVYFWQVLAGDSTVNTSSEIYRFNTSLKNAPVIEGFSPSSLTLTIAEGSPFNFSINATDVDGDLDVISFTIEGGCFNSTGACLDGLHFSFNETTNATESMIYTPEFNESGSYNITGVAQDDLNLEGKVVWQITVVNTNRPPTISTIPDVIWPEDTVNSSFLNLSQFITDLDGDSLTFSHNNANANISISIDAAGLVTLTPVANFTGAFEINFTATDGSNTTESNGVLLNVTPVNDIPTISTTTIPNPVQDQVYSTQITASDVDGDVLTYSDNSTVLSINQSGILNSYTPSKHVVGFTETFYVRVCDSTCVNQTYSITVQNVNDAPNFIGSATNITLNEDTTTTINLSQSFNDTDGDSLTFSMPSTTNVSITFSGTVATITPDSNFFGTQSTTINANDGTNTTTVAFAIIVTNVNDPPSLVSSTPDYDPVIKAGLSTGTGTKNFTSNAVDVDGDTLTYNWTLNGSVVSSGENATVSNLAQGVYTLKLTVADGQAAGAKTWTINATSTPAISSFSGATTNLSNVSDISNVENFTLAKSGEGTIKFIDNLDLTNAVDFDNCVAISDGLAAIDTECLGIDSNKDATITLTDLSYSNDPVIFYTDDFVTSSSNIKTQCDFCSIQSFDTAPATSGTVVFTVQHFTSFLASGNQKPVANAGSDKTSTPETTTTLDGSGSSDDDGSISSYVWSQVSGPSVAISNINSQTASINPTNIGTYVFKLTVTDNDGLTDDDEVTVTVMRDGATGNLSITDLDVKVNGESHKDIKNGETIDEDAKPGDTIKFNIEVKNEFTDDIEIEGIEVTITIEDIDDGDDLEESVDVEDLQDGEDDEVTVEFKVPKLVEEDQYNVIIEVEGEDEDDNDHDVRWELTLDVNKEKHEILLDRASLTPSRLTCDDETSLNVKVINVGEEDEDEVRLEIFSESLGIQREEPEFELDAGDDDDSSFSRTYRFLFRERLDVGLHPIQVVAYRDNRVEDKRTVALEVFECDDDRVDPLFRPAQRSQPTRVVQQQPKAQVQVSSTYTTWLSILLIIILGGLIFIAGALYFQVKKYR